MIGDHKENTGDSEKSKCVDWWVDQVTLIQVKGEREAQRGEKDLKRVNKPPSTWVDQWWEKWTLLLHQLCTSAQIKMYLSQHKALTEAEVTFAHERNTLELSFWDERRAQDLPNVAWFLFSSWSSKIRTQCSQCLRRERAKKEVGDYFYSNCIFTIFLFEHRWGWFRLLNKQ